MNHPRYIVSPLYDWTLIIASPIIFFVVAIAISDSWITDGQLSLYMHSDPENRSYLQIFLGTTLAAHFLLTFVRSHANPTINSLHPYRFWLIPSMIFAGMLLSVWFLVAMAVLTSLWDMWHSAQQTFGFGRIYDAKAGNPPNIGRRLDQTMNLFLWAGPILGGVTLLDNAFALQSDISISLDITFNSIPAYATSYQREILWGVITLAIPFTLYYIYAYYRFSKQGYKISFQKIFLTFTTGALSIHAWGFNSFGLAFFIMNFYHVVQYFAIMWHTEQRHLLLKTRLNKTHAGKWILLSLFITIPCSLGFLMEMADTSTRILFSLFLTISLLHYWYDAFMWSVGKKQV